MHEGVGWQMLKVDLHRTYTELDPAFLYCTILFSRY